MQREEDRNAEQERALQRFKAEQLRKEQEEVDRIMAMFSATGDLPAEVLAQQAEAEVQAHARNGQRVKVLPRVDDENALNAVAPEVKEQAEEDVPPPPAPAVVRQVMDSVTATAQQTIIARLEQDNPEFRTWKAGIDQMMVGHDAVQQQTIAARLEQTDPVYRKWKAVIDKMMQDHEAGQQREVLARLERTPDFQRRKAEREEKEAAELKQAMELFAAMETQEGGNNGVAVADVAVSKEVIAQQDAIARCEHAKALQAAARAAREEAAFEEFKKAARAEKAARDEAELKKALEEIAKLEAPQELDEKHTDESRRQQEELLACLKPSEEETARRMKAREEARLEKDLAVVLEASKVEAPLRNLRLDALAKLAPASVEDKPKAASEEPTVRVVFSGSANALELKPQLPVAKSAPAVEKKGESDAAKAAREARLAAVEKLAKQAKKTETSPTGQSPVGTQASTVTTTATSTTTTKTAKK
ncbi:MAG TPA: hypothetical protein VNK03_00965 [Gammaproteobacteria bacterium]|nr:hypothetical protein [Gammaproteobacteria bacterium]